ncbi:FAD-linked oxidase C-terminal domain-containing protein [Streptomyces sp. NPDC096132]|uniref:FAD-linked oxidase C-terminal domain-containing protein n=1 Tax=Streptomyces sp. NPDC096132 TaxID=3366075 RepID=UPI00381AF023
MHCPRSGSRDARGGPALSAQRFAVRARRLALPALERLGRPLIEDIAVPRSRLAEAAAGIRAVSARHDVPVFTIAHAADGDLHPIVVVAPSLARLPEAAWGGGRGDLRAGAAARRHRSPGSTRWAC